ncbi:MAG TPA: 3'(2'),5'-bisphosphate nucleotidase CysQ [Gammaproteobacteria bacterium]|nr:3'(2'),5'-bisphosphate nucleotidase CysQ [Gammaproteobacteria bacterium]
MTQQLLEPLHTIATDAGRAIMAIYDTDFTVMDKADDSPLTQADLAAHRIIVDGLRELTPDIPVLSEESADIPWAERQRWDSYWLVDPLDGTKEFIKKNGEFTVNIALIQNHQPVVGIVYAPALGVTYLGCEGVGAYRQRDDGEPEAIQVAQTGRKPMKVVASRSHRGGKLDAFLQALGEIDTVPIGSSLKFCLVATGEADIYPRLGPTCEWDTGAGHCVAQAAGAHIVAVDGEPLRYNSKESFLNPEFMVMADADFDWRRCLPELEA